jgi:hypothetical protein
MDSLRSLILIPCLMLAAITVSGQEFEKPRIAKIITVPSEPVLPGNCDSSTAGYLEIEGRTTLTEVEIGRTISSYLKDGYILTVYPPTKSGTFINLECPAGSKKSSAP